MARLVRMKYVNGPEGGYPFLHEKMAGGREILLCMAEKRMRLCRRIADGLTEKQKTGDDLVWSHPLHRWIDPDPDYSAGAIAPIGHASAQVPQSTHRFGSIL